MKKPLFLAIKEGSFWLIFEKPLDILSINDPQEILEGLEKLDDYLKAGKYIAGFLSYEASTGLDTAMESKVLTPFPKLVFGVFNGYSKVDNFNYSEDEYQIGEWQPSQKRAYYDENIKKTKSYIAAGETYQVNYTMRLSASFSGNARSFFCDLSQSQQANYAAYIEFDNYTLCSVSPELFFKLDGNDLQCKPMKGTASRGLSYKDDIVQQHNLIQSEKERAENLMIVDMIRNDMGKICKPGSVKVSNLFNTERYPTVWQMTSDVIGQTDASFSRIIRALFPCASITGAPKMSTMKIINELERTPRNIYTGSIGYFGPDRKAQFNVAIRTVLIDTQKRQAEYGVGGGIIWDSVDKNEYEECRIKSRVLTQKRTSFDLLETLLWNKNEGFFLLDYHLKRMQESAEYFSYLFNEKRLIEKLDQLTFGDKKNYKIRLLLSKNGELEIEILPVQLNDQQKLKVGLAKDPLKREDLFLYHKTTNRAVYQNAVNQLQKENLDDVLLWNENGELTESTVANLVVEKDGKFFTPPLKCGLLNGTFRQYLIDQCKLFEKVILKNDFKNYDTIYLINSVRKWQKVKLNF